MALFTTIFDEIFGAPISPPPSSPPMAVTSGVTDQNLSFPATTSTTTLDTRCLEADSPDKHNLLRPVSRTPSGSVFLRTLDRLLLTSAQERRSPITESPSPRDSLPHSVSGCAAHRLPRSKTCTGLSTGRQESNLDPLARSSLGPAGAYTQFSVSRKRPRSRSLCSRAANCDHGDPSGSTVVSKKPKLCEVRPRPSGEGSRRRRTGNSSILGLSGVFKLRYARGPGSLRRAESLRAEPFTSTAEEVVLNQVIEQTRTPLRVSKYSELSKAFFPPEFPIIVGSVASPYAANAPTEPTTPASTDHASSPGGVRSLVCAKFHVIEPPLYEFIPRAPLSREDAAERRIVVLLERERADRDADGFLITPPRVLSRTEDEEERFWMDAPNSPSHEYDTEVDDIVNARNARQRNDLNRALISRTPIELGVDSRILEEVMDWFFEVLPPEDEYTTSYTPGDLFDLLSTSNETRFHAGHLFMRHFHLVSRADEVEGQEALEAVTWDLAVACLALSVKFHRDVLFPLDVIYAQEFLDLAPHAMDFADLENAQRDILEALAYRIGSATPDAFMEELWEALPTLRTLVGFDGGWDGVQQKAWGVLCNALQQQDLLRFPVSVLTAAAIMEGVVDVLIKRYKSTGKDSRGKLCKRDSGSLKKAAIRCSRGVRLDVQEVLHISDEELLMCQKWLGVSVESK